MGSLACTSKQQDRTVRPVPEPLWLTVEFLPAYAPELNPVEPMWAYLGATDLANYSADGLEDLGATVKRGTKRLRRNHDNGKAFLKHSGLF